MTVLAHEWTIPGLFGYSSELAIAAAGTGRISLVCSNQAGAKAVALDLAGALSARDALDDLITNHLQHKTEGQQ